MENWLTMLGPYSVVVIFALYIIWNEFRFKPYQVKDRCAQLDRLEEGLKNNCKQTTALYDWHNKEDDDGVKIWYVRKSLESAIIKLADNIETQTQILSELLRETKKTDLDVQKIKEHIKIS